MTIAAKHRDALEAAGAAADDAIDIGATALTLAAVGRPDTSREPYRRHLEKLTAEVGAYARRGPRAPSLALKHEALSQVIHRRLGYAGTEDAFDDIEAANLMRVIDRRGGLPVALGILYLHAAHALGWPAAGVDFPGRFLLSLDGDGRRLIFDPFDGGAEVAVPELRQLLKTMAGDGAELRPEHYRAAGPRAVLLRLQNNIKVRHLEAGHIEAALRTMETMVMIAPMEAALWREQGMLHARLDQIPAAVAALEESLRRGRDDEARYKTSAFLQELRRRLG
ncbi:MAG: transglutaminase-like domain-containing protein [Magnetovibrio sp.]|nr:transglutaminase-like domain-containing protein [Magnetovibrio sp.]